MPQIIRLMRGSDGNARAGKQGLTAALPPQDDAAVSHAAKIEKSEGQLDFTQSAQMLHNKVGWCSRHCCRMTCAV